MMKLFILLITVMGTLQLQAKKMTKEMLGLVLHSAGGNATTNIDLTTYFK